MPIAECCFWAYPKLGESAASALGPINLGMKSTGERSAGKPHAAFDVAGAGNMDGRIMWF